MTSRERLITAARGGETDQKATISWPTCSGCDALITSDLQVITDHSGGEKIALFQVKNPFGLALEKGIDLNGLQTSSPVEAATVLADLVSEIKTQIQTALSQGADGVFYVLIGAQGAYCTPMQYGGLYLETDREILGEISEATLNVLFVAGNDDLYIDFVSDLPAHVFAWDAIPSTFDAAYVRTLRSGAQASSDPNSEIQLRSGETPIVQQIQSIQEPTHAV